MLIARPWPPQAHTVTMHAQAVLVLVLVRRMPSQRQAVAHPRHTPVLAAAATVVPVQAQWLRFLVARLAHQRLTELQLVDLHHWPTHPAKPLQRLLRLVPHLRVGLAAALKLAQ